MTVDTIRLPACAVHHGAPVYPTQTAAEAEITRRRTRAALQKSAAAPVTVQRCGGGWHVMRPSRPDIGGVLRHRVPCRQLARRLHQHGDWRVDAAYVSDEIVAPTVGCDACGHRRRVGQVRITWSPVGQSRRDEASVCALCAPEYLAAVVLPDAGDPDVHRDLIEVEIRRAA